MNLVTSSIRLAFAVTRAYLRLLLGRCDVCGGGMRQRPEKSPVCRMCGLTRYPN